jgi:hypothetical protein
MKTPQRTKLLQKLHLNLFDLLSLNQFIAFKTKLKFHL